MNDHPISDRYNDQAVQVLELHAWVREFADEVLAAWDDSAGPAPRFRPDPRLVAHLCSVLDGDKAAIRRGFDLAARKERRMELRHDSAEAYVCSVARSEHRAHLEGGE